MAAAQIAALAPWGVRLTKQGMWTALEIPSLQAAVEYEDRHRSWPRSAAACLRRWRLSREAPRRVRRLAYPRCATGPMP